MQPAKRLTLRVKEGFFRLEYGATSKTSMLGPQEELIAQQTIPTRLYLIQIQSLVGPKKNSWMMSCTLIWSISIEICLEHLMKIS